MSKKAVIEKKDYDLYTIHLPVTMLAETKRRRYLYSELGKKHPRFSDDCCFDEKLYFSKNGFSCDVVVMEKYRLAEIKNQNMHQRLFIEEKKTSVFNSKGAKVLKSPVFWLAVILGCTAGFFIQGIAKDKKQNIAVEEETPKSITYTEPFDIEKLLLQISENKGKIEWIDWSWTNSTEMFSASVLNVFPEVISQNNKAITFSTVSYSNGIPSMVLSVKGQREESLSENYSQKNVIATVRDFLLKNNVAIVEESLSPKSISFNFAPFMDSSSEKNVLELLSELIEKEDFQIARLKIQGKDKSLLQIQMEFSSKNGKGIQIAPFGKNLDLFIEKQPIIKTTTNPKTNSVVVEHVLGKKTGEIVYADGTKTVFYKTPEGKTVKTKEVCR